jgi:NAD(P)H-hydrate epimerase
MHTLIKTSDLNTVKPFLEQFYLPPPESYKGQNGRVLVVGGSHLFHSASIWPAEIAAHFVDIVHYASVEENNDIMRTLKKNFHNGIVVPLENIDDYVVEDDTILIGNGMVRGEISNTKSYDNLSAILALQNEYEITYHLTCYLLQKYKNKKFVLDAGSLQMMDHNWLLDLDSTPIITPHMLEFEKLFGINVCKKSFDEKIEIVKHTAKQFHSVIMLKTVKDIISDGENVYVIEGGNPGLTKGGTGDILAGITASLYTKNNPIISAVIASFILKYTADKLFIKKGYWYNNDDIIKKIPEILHELILGLT